MAIQTELDLLPGILLFWVLDREIKPFFIGISDVHLLMFKNFRDINRKFVDLGGHPISNSFALEEMIIKSWFGTAETEAVPFLNLVIILLLSKLWPGHLINMACWLQEEELLTNRSSSETPWLERLWVLWTQGLRFAILLLAKIWIS